MSTIGSLIVRISLGTAAFEAGGKKVKAATKDIEKHLRDLRSHVSTAATALTGLATASAVGLGALVKTSIDAQGKLADLSAQVGISTSALSNLAFAGGESGVGVDELGAALNKMNINLAKGLDPASETAKALKEIGLEAADLLSTSPEKAFGKLSDAINKLPTQAQRTAATVEILGKSGAALLPLMSQGSEGLAKAAEIAEKLGVTLSDIDTAKVDAAGDSMYKLGEVTKGIGNLFAAEFSPYIQKANEDLVALAASGEGLKGPVHEVFEGLKSGALFVAEAINLMNIGWQYAKAGVLALLAASAEPLSIIAKGVVYIGESLGLMKPEVAGVVDALAGLADAGFDEAGKALDEANKALMAQTPTEQFKKFEDAAKAAAEAAAEASVKAADAAREVGEQYTFATSQAQKLFGVVKSGASAATSSGLGKSLLGAADSLLGVGKAGASRFGAGVLKPTDGQKDATNLTNSLRNPAEIFADALAKNLDLNKNGLINADVLAKANKKSREDFNSALGLEKDPKEVLAEQMARLQSARNANLIDDKQFLQGKQAADGQFQQSTGGFHLSGALGAGSLEARSAILRNRFGDPTQKTQEAIKKNSDREVAQNDEAIAIWKEIQAEFNPPAMLAWN